MNKKQNYTAPEATALDLYPRESVLTFTSDTDSLLSGALTINPSTSILGGTDADGGIEW